MRSLFFWRKSRSAASVNQAEAPPAAEATAATRTEDSASPAAAVPAEPPVLRSAYALALQNPAVADSRTTPAPQHMTLLLTASRELAQIGTETRYTPRRPSLLPQLLEAINDEDASLRAMSRIVAQDPQLTGDLLRTANSALYRVSATPIESIERASAMLGTQGIRTLIAASLVQPLACGAAANIGPFGDLIWEHSLYSASAAEAWAARSQNADPFTAHLLALMHGLGCVAVYRVISDLYALQPQLQPDAAVMAGALETNAAVTAARIAASWGLSEPTRQALEIQSSAAPVAAPSPLGQALHFGLATGSVTLLCKYNKLPPETALQKLAAAGYHGAQTERIWDRLLRAYVRP
jgi:HD-like signal output (HDOD) protein